jgi:LacI family transcriptional regulator
MSKKLSLSDIAKELNISATTVSIVINGKAKERRISQTLVDKILKLVDEKGYKINLMAKGLRTGKSKIIGLFVEDISNPFFANFARLIEEKAYAAGYKILFCSTNDNVLKTQDLIQIFRSRQVDGYIITPPEGIEEDVRSLLESKLPIVLFDRQFLEIPTNYVGIDNPVSAYLGVSHLLSQGYRNIAFVTIISNQSQMIGRLEGYKRCIQENKLSENVAQIDRTKGYESIQQQIKLYLKTNTHIDAILFSTNFLTMQGLKSIKELNLTIPNDIAIISFDDNEFYELFNPTITAIAQPIDQLASNVIQILLKDLSIKEQHQVNYSNIVIPGSLILRDSSPRKIYMNK